ncbi:MAG: hypothetical protein KDK36_09825 [Leptospiraceae bacterium]|nr:hypothetical protein [Leptospiraceae bacterium]
MKTIRLFILIIALLLIENCESKYVYLTDQDKEILNLIQTEQFEKLLEHFGNNIEFDYGSESYTMFSLKSDKEDYLKGKKSEYYKFIFQLDDFFKEKNWLSFREALLKAYRVQGENKETNDDKTYNRYIHIFTDKSYNRVGLKCIEENKCKINNLYISSSKAGDVNL